MCPSPKREVDFKITYQGITLGYIHVECMDHVIKADSELRMRDKEHYSIWSLRKEGPAGKIRYPDPCINSFTPDLPEEIGAA